MPQVNKSKGFVQFMQTLADNNEGTETALTSIDLTTGKSGIGRLVFGDGLGYADFIFTTLGVVTLIVNSANVFTTLQTGTSHVIIKDNGSNVRITNELGSSTVFNLIIQYTN